MIDSKGFFRQLDLLDLLIKHEPEPEVLDRFASIVNSSKVYKQYAFQQLDSSSWILPLRQMGLLSVSSKLISDDNASQHRKQVWSQAGYLIRMAGSEERETQEQVLDIMLEVGETDDSYIHQHLAESALVMPIELAKIWVAHEVDWLRAGNTTEILLEDSLSKLAARLAKEGEATTALALVGELLAVSPDPEAEKKKKPIDDLEEVMYASPEPQIRCEKYYYKDILSKTIPGLISNAPWETMELLCKLLDRASEYSSNDPEESKLHDLSYVSRPAIEDHKQNNDYYFQHYIINYLRDVALKICQDNPERINEVVEILESFEWDIFKRISLYLLQIVDSAPTELIKKRLLNEEYMDSISLHHEYYHLLKKRFRVLQQKEQQQLLNWIDEATKEKERLEEFDQPLSEIQKQTYLEHWQYRKFSAIETHLPSKLQEQFLILKKKFGESDIPPDFHSWTGEGWVGPVSAKSAEDLAEMSNIEIIEYLKVWQPTEGFRNPTPNGLGSELRQLVKRNPERFTQDIPSFMDDELDPTYIRHLLGGYSLLLEENETIPFEQVFQLCRWIVEKPTTIQDRSIPDFLKDGFEMDLDWRHSQQEINQFFSKIFDDNRKLPYELRQNAWEIIQPLTEETDPDLDYEKEFGGDNSDPLTLSLNTTRGYALHNMMRYAMWVCRWIKKNEGREPTFIDLPEVQEILEKHLDLDFPYGHNQTDRAVYGKWLPQLVMLGEKWVESNRDKIFPTDPDLQLIRQAAWNSHLMYGSGVYKNVSRVLRGVYQGEVELLEGKDVIDDNSTTPASRLVEHIMLFYAWGDVTLDKEDMVDRLFNVAPDELKKRALEFLGQRMSQDVVIDLEILKRLRKLWDWRIDNCAGLENMPEKELATFGWWFATNGFDSNWAFQNLEAALRRTTLGRSGLKTLERIDDLFQAHPSESLRCVRLIIEKHEDSWYFYHGESDRKGIWTILEQGIQHNERAIRQETEDLIHLVGSMGYLDYRELLKRANSQNNDSNTDEPAGS